MESQDKRGFPVAAVLSVMRHGVIDNSHQTFSDMQDIVVYMSRNDKSLSKVTPCDVMRMCADNIELQNPELIDTLCQMARNKRVDLADQDKVVKALVDLGLGTIQVSPMTKDVIDQLGERAEQLLTRMTEALSGIYRGVDFEFFVMDELGGLM